ncbi:helix-turn-helix domain-containing protein [Microbacteriaceae bacterium VKM Ac-2854]|nr:helix-turn-helix domain-containing protein [Microbacteriaceae bacterium VKM Ac-2854]
MVSELSDGIGRWLTIADAAELLSLTPSQVLDLIHRGELAGVRTGARGRWRIERALLSSYLEAEETAAAEWEAINAQPLREIGGGRILR